MTDQPHLSALADRMGIEPAYTDLQGVRHICSDDTKLALLAAMGLAVASESDAQAALHQLDRDEDANIVPKVRVLPVRELSLCGITVRVPLTMRGDFSWRAELTTEQGKTQVKEGAAERTDFPTLRIDWPEKLPIGYHEVTVLISGNGQEYRGVMRLILTPPGCRSIDDVLKGQRAFGLCANLYTLRSKNNWGVGDFTDLSALVRWMGGVGGAFVGTNPLHALFNRDPDISPYSPVSRLFRNPIYIDVTCVPEWSEYSAAISKADERLRAEKIAGFRAVDEVSYQGVWSLKRDLLRELHRLFMNRHVKQPTERGKAFRAYVASQGPLLEDYATFMALVEHQTAQTGDGRDFCRWPAELRDPRSSAVVAFRREHGSDVDFHCFLQFEIDRQLALIAAEARRGGLALGLYPDLAIGTSPRGADVWSRPELFVQGARIGCPPDYYASEGQEWGLPPVNAERLRDDGYEYWIRMLRANLAHAGALRIDHVIGLKRQFWIPAGGRPCDGAYVRNRLSDLLGILALESVRHGAIIIGEDLGTVPEGFSVLLKRWGILSCQVMYFERGFDGGFLPAQAYSDRALVTTTTHDHVSLEGFTAAADLQIRRRVGAISTDAELNTMLAARRRDVELLKQRLVAENVMSPATAASFTADWTLPQSNGHDPVKLCGSVHRFLAGTPAPLVGIMLDDVAREMQPVNVPGIGPDKLRCWARKMTMPVESISAAATSRAAVEALLPIASVSPEQSST